MQQITGKIPPQALDLERALLGACLIEKGAISEVAPILGTEKVFYTESHKKIYKAISELYNEGGDIDMLTVIERVRKNGDSSIVGGEEKDSVYISQLTINVNSAAHITTHARILVEKFMMREIIKHGGDINKYCYSNEGDAFQALDKLQSLVLELSNLTNGGKGYEMYKEIAYRAMNSLGDLRDGNGKLKKIKSGLQALDNKTGGFCAGDFPIIAARPGMGKTALVVSMMTHFAKTGLKGIMFSLEMSKDRVMMRVFSSMAEIESDKIRDGNFTESEWERLLKASGQVSEFEIGIDDTGGITLAYLRSVITKFVIEQGRIDFVVVDYIQLMTGSTGKSGNREQEIAKISRGLKNTAKEFEIPMITLAQLSRAVETRGGDKIPILSDLRESGSIEQDADQVMFLYRPEYYGITEDEEGNSTAGVMEIHLAKNRHGATAMGEDAIRVRFKGQFTQTMDFEFHEGFRENNGADKPYSEFETTNTTQNLSYDGETLPPSSEF